MFFLDNSNFFFNFLFYIFFISRNWNIINSLFKIPGTKAKKGEYPIIVNEKNFEKHLGSYKPQLEKFLKRKKAFENHIGELIVLHYRKENHENIQESMPFLPQYRPVRDGKKTFISIQALYDRLAALKTNLKTNYKKHHHTQVPIV